MSEHALRRHQAQGLCYQRKTCAEQHLLSPIFTPNRGNQPRDDDISEGSSCDSRQGDLPSPPRKRAFLMERVAIPTHDIDFVSRQIGPLFEEASAHDSTDNSSADECGANYDSDSSAQDFGEEDIFMGGLPQAKVAIGNSPDKTMRDNFRECVEDAKKNFLPFTKEEITAVRLLHTLKAKQAPMNSL